jgi:hypothetical protein
MALAFMSPDDFVYWVTVEGLPTTGGNVRLNKYVSADESFGGSDTSQNLMNQLAGLMKRKGTTPPTRNYARLSTGQGYVTDFIAVWSWMHQNLDDVRKLNVQTSTRKKNAEGKYDKVDGKVLKLADVFKVGRPFPDGMGELIANGCFGWDCIGFVVQYLITIDHLDEYKTWYSRDYITRGGFKELKTLDDISPLCVLVFGNWHIVLVNLVYDVSYDDATGLLTATVSVSQSYSGGPHTRPHCTLIQQRLGRGFGPIRQVGVLDREASLVVGKHPDLVPQYPPYIDIDPVPDFVPGVE